MLPWAHPSPYPKRHLDRFSHFCTAYSRRSLYFTMGRTFPPQNCPRAWGSPHIIHGSLGPPESTYDTTCQSVQPFLQGSRSGQTDKPTKQTRYSICNNRLRCGLIMQKKPKGGAGNDRQFLNLFQQKTFGLG